MDGQPLSPREVALAQRRFTLFTAFNVISFQLLSGNIITLYALRLGASNFLIGALYSFVPLAQVMPLVGRAIVARWGAVKTLSTFWFIRYVLMLPILFASMLANAGRPGVGIVLIVVSVVGFNIARGIGITGHNPVVAGITTERDRGSFLAKNQIVIHSGAIFTGVAIALVLGSYSTLIVYTLLIATGIASGLGAAIVSRKLPEPPPATTRRSTRFVDGIRTAVAGGGVRRFVAVLALKSFVIAMAVPFLVVFLKRVYGLSDSAVVAFTVIGSLGAISMAIISGLAIDSTGPKPVSQVFGAVLLVAVVMVALAPQFERQVAFWFFAGGIFFLANMGANGLDNALGNYFFRLIKPEDVLNVGILNFLVAGAAATAGSLAGGAILDGLEQAGMTGMGAFRLYYGGLAVVLVATLAVVTSLRRLGPDFTARNVLAMFLSPRDLHAMSILRRLRRHGARDETRDQDMIRALGQTRSALSSTQLLNELNSPRFNVRAEALNALAASPPDPAVSQALIDQVKTQEFTTAYRAAEILGRNRVTDAIPALRESLHSGDFFLAGKSMTALALLGDRASVGSIEQRVAETRNPRLLIHGAAALERFGEASSVEILIDKLKERLPGFVRDELNLALAGLLGLHHAYYRLYLTFIDDKTVGIAALKDYVQERAGAGKRSVVDAKSLTSVAEHVAEGGPEFSSLVTSVYERISLSVDGHDMVPLLSRAAAEPELLRHSRLRFLLAGIAILNAAAR